MCVGEYNNAYYKAHIMLYIWYEVVFKVVHESVVRPICMGECGMRYNFNAVGIFFFALEVFVYCKLDAITHTYKTYTCAMLNVGLFQKHTK